MKIIWSLHSLDDLRSINAYIAEDNVVAAQQVVHTVVSVVEKQLSIFPRSGRVGRVPNTYVLGIAKLPYVVLYRIINQDVEIARVYHTSRQWPENFGS